MRTEKMLCAKLKSDAVSRHHYIMPWQKLISPFGRRRESCQHPYIMRSEKPLPSSLFAALYYAARRICTPIRDLFPAGTHILCCRSDSYPLFKVAHLFYEEKHRSPILFSGSAGYIALPGFWARHRTAGGAHLTAWAEMVPCCIQQLTHTLAVVPRNQRRLVKGCVASSKKRKSSTHISL